MSTLNKLEAIVIEAHATMEGRKLSFAHGVINGKMVAVKLQRIDKERVRKTFYADNKKMPVEKLIQYLEQKV